MGGLWDYDDSQPASYAQAASEEATGEEDEETERKGKKRPQEKRAKPGRLSAAVKRQKQLSVLSDSEGETERGGAAGERFGCLLGASRQDDDPGLDVLLAASLPRPSVEPGVKPHDAGGERGRGHGLGRGRGGA